MADGDSASMDVDLLEWNSKRLDRVNGLRSECFVDFIKVDVFLAEACLLQNLWDGVCRTDAHDSGRDTDNGGADEFANDRKTKTFGDGTTSQKDCSCTVGDL